MRLNTRFAILVGLVSFTVCLAIAAASWAFLMLQREVSEPFIKQTELLGSLDGVKADLMMQMRLLRDPLTGESRPDVASTRDRILEARTLLESRAELPRELGAGTTRTLLEGIRESQEEVTALLDERDGARLGPLRLAAIASLGDVSSLIDRIESRVLTEAAFSIDYTDRLKGRLMVVVYASVAGALLFGLLAVLLLRRWVLGPVRRLRIAAAEIGAGNFAHRVAVIGRDELAELSAEVNHMSAMVDRMQRERVEQERLAATGEMLRRVAHNLRNPLAGIRSLAELTRGGLPDGSDLGSIHNRIIASVDRLEAWLADLLQITRPMEIEPERHDVKTWLSRVIESHAAMAESLDVTLRLETSSAPTNAVFDRFHLEHALVALVSNAIQATPRGGSVEIAASADSGAEAWRICVRDEGPGVPADLREQVFRPYFTTKRHGNGIGLAIAQQIVRGHGGEIAIIPPNQGFSGTLDGNGTVPGNTDDDPDGSTDAAGACFLITLPLHATAAVPTE
jgi:signal transduction histidine kinase